MPYEDLLFDREGAIATVILNRPEKRNALSPGMREGLTLALKEIAEDDTLRVLILTGAGEGFCAGVDIGALASRQIVSSVMELGRRRGRESSGFELAPLFRNLDKMVIAAVNGAAVGGGFCLAMVCDLRIASEKARFSTGYARLGLATEWGMSYWLPRLIGASQALELMALGDFIEAREAERLGLVSRVVPAEELMKAARTLAMRLAQGPPVALRQIKRAIYRGLESTFDSQLAYEAYVQSLCFQTEDHKEAVKAFQEKRPPVFQGR